MKSTRENLKKLPSKPGVYLFYQKNIPVYIGKASNLKTRVLSHFQNAKYDLKEKTIIKKTDRIETIVTDGNFPTILLEAELIKKWLPKYNIRSKDDKNFLYIKITVKEKYPKVLIVRKEYDGKSLYFGPFSSTRIINKLLREIRKIVPFCSQKKLSKRPCFYSKIGLCHPCPNYLETGQVNKRTWQVLYRQYRSNIKKIINILKGKIISELTFLTKELKNKIKQENYEEALKLRNKIYLFQNLISERAFVDEDLSSVNPPSLKLRRIECYDVSNLFGRQAAASMVVFSDGLPDKKEYKRFRIKTVKKISDTEMLAEVLKRRFSHKDWTIPDLLVIDGGKPQLRTAFEVLRKFKIHLPLVGIAKNPDRIIRVNNGFKTSCLPENSSFFNLLKHIRDESHRFAKKYHLFLRKKKMML
jgi:excinuclease ABC subunit C